MKRAMNFNAGPACLPLSVLEEVQAEMLDFAGSGMSIMEISHRSAEYDKVHQATQSAFKEILGLGDDYAVIFFGGGATTQFTLVAMNYLKAGVVGDYLLTGAWSQKAYKEARLIGSANVAATTEVEGKFTRIPKPEEIRGSDHAAYLHLTSNNTIFGTQWQTFPKVKVPLVADMSSDFLWRPINAKDFALIYAGAQKNLGPAGVAVVLVRKEFLAQANDKLPSMFSYKVQAEAQSLYNTPPCLSIYVVGKVLQWIKDQGGLATIEQRNRKKASTLYQTIDDLADFYRSPVAQDSRSTMNVVFTLPTAELETQFLAKAKAAGMVGLKGHRSVGGVRASIYNAVPQAWVEALCSLMREFARTQG
jgi:phosphoserine aminotransferase